MFKKVICFILAMATVFSLSACKKNTDMSSGSYEWEYEYETVYKDNSSESDDDKSGNSNNTISSNNNVSSQGTSSNKQTIVVENAGKDPNADYSVSGTVTVAVDTARANDYQALFDALKQVYPKINLKFDYFAHPANKDNAAEYLSTRAAAGNLPDIVYDEAGSLPTYILQGWIHPLDEFVKNDPDYKKYVPNNLKKDYTYGGKLYALPHQAHFEAFFLNLDVLDALNLKTPSLSWTVKDFETYCKKATTEKYSAQESFGALYSGFTNCYDKKATLYGYHMDDRTFYPSGLISSIEYLLNLKSVPGLEAETLRGSKDYSKKFGTGTYSDNFVAFHKGLTLFHGLGTWEYAVQKKNVTNFKWKMWTFPQSSAGVMPYHVDHCFMTSSCKNTKAAWQVLRYITYSYEGNVARLSMYDAKNKGKYALQNTIYWPTSTHPKIAEKFKTLPNLTDVELYLYENIDKCYRYDMRKLIPDWSNIVTNYIATPLGESYSGSISLVNQTITEALNKADSAVKKSWSNFETKLKTVQKQFDATH